MRTKQVANIVGVSEHTIRLWANRYSDYLAPGASPEKGAIREFSEDDVRVFLTVKRESDRRLPLEDIRPILDSGDWVTEIPEVREMDEAVPVEEHMMALARIDTLGKQLESTRRSYEREIERLEADLERTRKNLEAERTQKDRYIERVIEVQQEIGLLKGKLEEIEKRRGLFRR